MAIALATASGCRQPEPKECFADFDCETCTQSDCHYCLEDGMCITPGATCAGDVARNAGECEAEGATGRADAGPDASPAAEPDLTRASPVWHNSL